MMTLEIDTINSNFSYELEYKSNLDTTYEYNLNLIFENSFTNSPLLIL